MILGNRGNSLKRIKNKYSDKVNIIIPLKNEPSNLIIIEGHYAVDALCDIIKIINPL